MEFQTFVKSNKVGIAERRCCAGLAFTSILDMLFPAEGGMSSVFTADEEADAVV